MSLPILLGCVCVLVVTLYLQYRWRHRRVLEAASKLPCPPTLPLIGNAHLLIGDSSKSMKRIVDWANNYNGFYCLWIGPSPVFVVANAADAKVILQNTGKVEKNHLYSRLNRYLGEGLITARGDVWRKYRPLINQIFRQSNLEQFIALFHGAAEKMTEEIDEISGNGPVDTFDIIFNNILDSSVGLVYGGYSSNFGEVKSNVKSLMEWVAKEHVIKNMNPIYSWSLILDLFYWRMVKRADEWLSSFNVKTDEIVKDFKNKKGSNISNHWTSLLDVWNEVSSGTFQDRHWIDEILTIFAAALDTTTALVSFLLFSLATNQEAQDKVYSEIKEVLGSRRRGLTLSDLNSLTYLGQAIAESMRLHCIVPLMGRRSTKEIKLRDLTLPAGCDVWISLHAMGLNPDHFSEPYDFNPDRFKSKCNQDENSLLNSFMPFGWGPRLCIGKSYAILQIKTIMVHIISKYKLVTPMKLEDIQYNIGLVNGTKNSVIDFQRREN